MPNDLHAAVTKFSEVAESFCTLIESAPQLDRDEFFKRLYDVLSRLINEGARLNMVEPATEELLGESRTTEEWSALFQILTDKLGGHVTYHEYFDPYDPTEHGMANLADDLTDIYFDMKEGLQALRKGKSAADIIFEWRLGFETHWGAHAVDALRALHYLQFC